MAQKYLVSSAQSEVIIEAEQTEDGLTRVRLNEEGPWKTAQLERIGDSRLFMVLIDNEPTELYVERRRGGAIVTIGRHTFDYSVDRWRAAFEQREATGAAVSGEVTITAPMTGSVVEVMKKPGDHVDAGDVLLVIESMKMDNELRSPAGGTVTAVNVAAGDRVTAGQVLAVIES